MTSPRVSVVCIFLDEEDFLAEAVESVLAQDFDDFELLLIDDGSSDSSRQIAKSYAARDPNRIRYFDHSGHANRGCSASRNLGVKNARADLIAFIDGDDVWRPEKLREQVAILEAQPEIGMLCGAMLYWHSWQGGSDNIRFVGGVNDAISFPPDTSLQTYPIGSSESPSMSDIVVYRSLFEAVGGCVEEFPRLYEDQAFCSKIYLASPVWFSSKVWSYYRQHRSSLVATANAEDFRKIRKRFLHWYGEYILAQNLTGRGRLIKALRRARWRLEHPWVSRQFDRLRRLRQVAGL